MENVKLTPDEISIIANALSFELHNNNIDDQYRKEAQELYDKFDKLECKFA
jgi:hypothetical protein